jgi:hypothetical protein
MIPSKKSREKHSRIPQTREERPPQKPKKDMKFTRSKRENHHNAIFFHTSRGQILYKIMKNLAYVAKELGSSPDG